MSAITGGNAFRTMMQTWKYTLPGVPSALRVRAHRPARGCLTDASAAERSMLIAPQPVCSASWRSPWSPGAGSSGPAGWPERALCAVAALLLLYLATPTVLAGAALFRRRGGAPSRTPAPARCRCRPHPCGRNGAFVMRTMRIAAGLLAAAMAMAACGGQRDDAGDPGSGGRLTIATGNTTGVYYVLGGGLAKIISSDLEGYKATAEATKASKENVERVVAGQNDIAFSVADTAADAAKGENSFTEKQPIRALMRIYDNTTQVVVRTDSGINSVKDMKGKSVSTDPRTPAPS